jgi:hypothetical protein
MMEESRDMARAPEPIDKEVSGIDQDKGVSSDAPASTGANGTDVMGPGDGAASGNQPITGVGPSKGVGGKAAAGATVGTAAPVAAQAAALATFINWLKTVMMAAVAAAQSLWSMAVSALVGAGKAIVGFFSSVGTAISSAVGGVVSASTAGVASFVAIAIGATGIVGTVAMREGNNAARDGLLPSCTVAVDNAVKASEGAQGDFSAQTEENAKTIYSVLSAWGMSNENIAGILGNWSHESGIDPTSVETIFDEKFTIGPRKQDAELKNFKMAQVDPAYAARFPAIDLMGIGLGQWTNGRNTLLTEYAKSINKPWYTLETQLGFMVSKDDPTRVGQVKALINNSEGGSVSAATSYFLTKWEGINDGTLGTREAAAGTWFSKMGGWSKNQSLADSILAQSGSAVTGANNTSVAQAASQCKSFAGHVDNSSLVKAALSYAWPYNDEGKGNDGTDLYKYLHKEVLGESDHFFASCDRTVATAVRWSGTDDSYPAGGVSNQLAYLQGEGSSKWKPVDYNGDKSKLQPGDILLRTTGGVSHTVMYVGEDSVKEVWGEGNYESHGEIVSGSLNDRSPTVGQFYTGSTGLDTDYLAFRNVTKEQSSKFTSVTVPSSMQKGQGDKGTRLTPGP